MSLIIKINRNPSRRTLRQFALIVFLALVIAAVVLHGKSGINLSLAGMAWLCGFGVAILLVCLFSSGAARILYLTLMMVTLPLGIMISYIVLVIFYFGIITPIGLIFRLIGRDLLERKFTPDSKSYWKKHEPVGNIERYFQQF